MRVSHTSIDTPLYATRTPSQRDEVGDRTNAIHSVPWKEVGSPPQPILSHSRAEAGHPIEHRSCDPARRPPILQSGVATRSTGIRIFDSSIRLPPSPQSSDKSNSGGSTMSRSQVMDINTRPARGSSPMVVEGGCNVGGDVFSSGRARSSGFYRRVHKRMGHIMRRSKLARKVALSRASYKLAGDEDGTCSPPISPVSTEGSADLDRQLYYGGVSEEGRRYAISGSSPSLPPHPEVGLRPTNSHVSAAYYRPPECVSGLSVEDRSSDSVGVGGSDPDIRVDMRKFSMGSSGGGSFREQSESSSPLLCVAMPGSGSVGDGCSDVLMAAEGNLCLPPDVLDTSVPTSSQTVGRFPVFVSSSVVPAGQVDTNPNVVSGDTSPFNSGIRRDVSSTTLGLSPPFFRTTSCYLCGSFVG